MLGNGNDIRAMVNYGDGIGRYVGLGFVPDGYIDEASNEIETAESLSWFVSYRAVWNDKWRSNFMYGTNSIDYNDDTQAGGLNDNASSFHVNLIHNVLPKLDIGAEIIWGERETCERYGRRLYALHALSQVRILNIPRSTNRDIHWRCRQRHRQFSHSGRRVRTTRMKEIPEIAQFLRSYPGLIVSTTPSSPDCAKHIDIAYYRQGDDILTAGSENRRLHIIRSGAVELRDDAGDDDGAAG